MIVGRLINMFMLIFIPSRLRDKLYENIPLVLMFKVASLFIMFFIIHLVGFGIIENVSWNESLWQTWQTFTTVGYGNRPAESESGRFFTMIVSTFGIALFGAFISSYFDYKIYNKERRKTGMTKNPFKDGYVIFNYPGEHKIQSFVNEIRYIEPNVGICIVDESLEELPSSISLSSNIHFVKGSLLHKDTYENARLKDNKVVIIFPKESHVSESDAATKVIVDLVYKFTGDATRILHVLVDSKNSWLFDDSPSQQILQNMAILSVVQESQDRYSAAIFETLFKNTEGENPSTVKPNKIIGWRWDKFVETTMSSFENNKIRVNPLALIKDGKINPCPEPSEIITENSYISIISEGDFNWDKYESGLSPK